MWVEPECRAQVATWRAAQASGCSVARQRCRRLRSAPASSATSPARDPFIGGSASTTSSSHPDAEQPPDAHRCRPRAKNASGWFAETERHNTEEVSRRRPGDCATSRRSATPTPIRIASNTRANPSTTTACPSSSDRCRSIRFSARMLGNRRRRAWTSNRNWRRAFWVRRRYRRMPQRRCWTAPKLRPRHCYSTGPSNSSRRWACRRPAPSP